MVYGCAMKRRMLLLALVCAAACSDSAGPEDSHLGRYRLLTIDGRDVPAIMLENANSRLEFLSGSLRLNADGTFTDSTEIRVTPMFRGQPLPGGEVVHRFDVAWGLYRTSRDTVYFDSVRGEHYFMVRTAGGSLVQELVGSILHYRR